MSSPTSKVGLCLFVSVPVQGGANHACHVLALRPVRSSFTLGPHPVPVPVHSSFTLGWASSRESVCAAPGASGMLQGECEEHPGHAGAAALGRAPQGE